MSESLTGAGNWDAANAHLKIRRRDQKPLNVGQQILFLFLPTSAVICSRLKSISLRAGPPRVLAAQWRVNPCYTCTPAEHLFTCPTCCSSPSPARFRRTTARKSPRPAHNSLTQDGLQVCQPLFYQNTVLRTPQKLDTYRTSMGSYRSCAAVLHFTNLLGLFRTVLVKFG